MRQLAIAALLAHACASAACGKTDPAHPAGAVPPVDPVSEDGPDGPGAGVPATPVKLAELPPLRPLPELACGKLPMRLAGAPLSLLAGRLHLQPLEGARIQARGHNIMAAPESDEVETRVFLEHEGQKLVIMTRESLQLAGALSAGTAVATVEPMVFAPGAGLTAHALPTADAGLRAVAVVPELHVARTLGAGERELVRSAGERALPGPGNLHLRVDQDWVLTTQEGPDFSVHRLHRLVPLGQTAPEIGVYVGRHPRQPGQPETETLPGRLFGKAITWAGPAAEAGQRQVRRIIVELPGGDGLQAHVWIVAASQGGLAGVQALAESLRVGSKP